MNTIQHNFHLMAKPSGAICNLDCKYCYFLSKERLYPDSNFRMSETVLEEYIRQYIHAQNASEITFAWQGGEPTLPGLDFYQQVIRYQQKHKKAGMRITNTLQTNAVSLDDDWCKFFASNNFLIGVSLDGTRQLHDRFRVDKGGHATFEKVMRGIERLKKYQVAFNILTTVHAENADYPLEVYRFLRDEISAQFIQFIPIVERDNDTGFQEGSAVTSRSVGAKQYGDFLISVFDEWVQHDVGRVFVQLFDVVLAAWAGDSPGLCIFEETCGSALALEHNGDVYSCDHYVEPKHKLGNIINIPLSEIVISNKQKRFGRAKQTNLPNYCINCDVRFVCNGGCPKNRFTETPDGEANLNYLCEGYKSFFSHINEPMQFMVGELRQKRPPANIMSYLKRQRKAWRPAKSGG